MARLTTVKPRLATLRASRLARVWGDRVAFDRERDRQGWRRWYKTARWQRLRWAVLVRDAFTCQWPGCGRLVADTSQLVADHRVPHRGDEALFWREANLWTLCQGCHSSAKQREENAAR